MNQAFQKNIIGMWGSKGQEWLNKIPDLISDYEKKWEIKVGEPFMLSYNYTALVEQTNGNQAVLKIGFSGDKEFFSERDALKIFNGTGAARLIKEDNDNAVILLERVTPGETLDSLNDNEKETFIASRLLKKLWKDVPQNDIFIPLDRWHEGFERVRNKYNGNPPIPQEIYKTGELLFRQLLDTTKEKKLLHGDFHHGNILSSERDEWLAIDPKGVSGDPAYEIAVFLYNPRQKLSMNADMKNIIQQRIAIFSQELNLDRQRIIDWGIAQSILSAVWSVEDHGEGWEYCINFAKLLQTL